MKRLRFVLAILLTTLCLVAPVTAFAQTKVFDEACKVPGAKTSEACTVDGSDTLTGSNGALGKAAVLISYLAGIASIILFAVGGLMYVLSNGDASKVTNAKNTILYAVIGLVIVIAARGIIIFVINRL